MSNSFGIPTEVEQRIRTRDKKCVYCHKEMIQPDGPTPRTNWATIEHFRQEGPFYWNEGLREEDLAICCLSCNASRGIKKLRSWFKMSRCVEKNINEKTVAKPVQEYIKRRES